MTRETTHGASRPSRRTVVRGAAWVTPAVAVAAAAPAFAASPCTTTSCPDISFGAVPAANSSSAGNGWSFTQTASSGTWSNNNAVGFQPASATSPFNGKGPTFAAAAEPSTSGRRLTLIQAGQPALAAGCSYTVKVGIITYTSSSTPLVLRVLVGTTSIGTYSSGVETINNNTNFDRGIKSFVVPPGTTGAVSFRLEFGNAGDHEDIHLYSPSVACA